MPLLFAYSSERRESLGAQLGKANYSYRFAEDALVRLLDRNNYSTVYIQNPEIFKMPASYRGLLKCEPEDVVHIAFRSTENIRPMFGAKNICHFAWEFDVMSDRTLIGASILTNQVRMLSLMDEVWVACEYSKRILNKYGLSNTFVVPAPVVDDAAPQRDSLSGCLDRLVGVASLPLMMAGGVSREANSQLVAESVLPLVDQPAIRAKKAGKSRGNIFLAVLNPGDLRKNLLNLIEGFQMAVDAVQSDDILIIKLIVPNSADIREAGLYDHFRPRCNVPLVYRDSRVICIVDYLTDDEMEALFCLADYYLSPTHCEGFNRPLLQAMSFGTVPVSTSNTAMADYITTENSIIIEERRFAGILAGMGADVANTHYAIDYASRIDIARACRNAMMLSDGEWENMSALAAQTVLEKYGEKAILKLVEERLTTINLNYQKFPEGALR